MTPTVNVYVVLRFHDLFEIHNSINILLCHSLQDAIIEFKAHTGENVPVIVTDNSMLEDHCISFIDKNDVDKFQKNDQTVQAICRYLFQTEECYTPSYVLIVNLTFDCFVCLID